ncbi:class I SAM-dependent methyltransferase [Thalassospira lucentensis]|uniref:class I SAM-dependent methyltransferase n=1 Tax=Thalassospira lucentensis TaxID=168935 RepID=UPI0029425EC6|nr:class I SAM-dependent methyltransferase [Thalassospira lucentensis]WOI10105.1 class I SAM-dependent methyltransferase [Thalassospira lucentensis]
MGKIDLTKAELNYERFRDLAKDRGLSERERIGFPEHYRSGYEDAILDDIALKLEFAFRKDSSLLDIGCGASPMTSALFARAQAHNIAITANDSPEMLSLIKSDVLFTKLPGKFPDVLENALEVTSGGYDLLLCYSVLHYIIVDGSVFDFVDAVCLALKPGGTALIGDIPNLSKRRRFFTSEAGIAFHKEFMKTDEPPAVDHYEVHRNAIDDAVLFAIVARAHANGNDAYVVPQPRTLPMFNRRDDIIIQRR